jgi:hypothetical protein
MNAVWSTVTGSPLLRSFPPAPLPRCGRGVVHERGMVDSHRIAPAPLIPPLPRLVWKRKGARGEGEGTTSPFLARSVGEEGGPGGKVRGQPPPSSPAAWERKGGQGGR